jgi:hypothetical protein
MKVAAARRKSHSHPPIHKTFVATHEGHDIYSIDPSAIRNTAQPDEEFTNFAIHDDFPDLIPEGQLWLGEKNLDKEGVFFIANALAQFKQRKKGSSDDRAYTAGLNVERMLREKLTGLKFRDGKPHRRVPQEIYIEPYITLPDPQFPIDVWLVDGNLVRCLYKTDYAEGGHGYVYRWVPRQQIWVEKDIDRWELPFIVSHEYIELRLMRDEGIEYDQAHEICSKVEFKLRKGKGVKSLIVPGQRRLSKRDLPRLTRDDVLQYVVRNYLTKS